MRKLVTVISALTPGQMAKITETAENHGFAVFFFDDAETALTETKDAEILFTNVAELAKHAPALRWFACSNAGVDPFLLPGAFASPDAVLTNASGAYGVTISEHIVMVTLELMRRELDYRAIVARREWKRDLDVRSIHGSRITLLGTGDIGTQAARRLRAFEPSSLTGVNRSGRNPDGAYDRVVTIGRLDEVLPETDLLIMSLPGTAETVRVMDARRIALLPETAFLLNVGRGSALDEAALADMLKAGKLAGAALDVFEREPLPPDDPLWDCPGLLITPHTAGNVSLAYTLERIVEMFLENFEAYCAGRPLRQIVDMRRGY